MEFLNKMKISTNLRLSIDAALKAGESIIEIYNSNNFESTLKNDNSPITNADLISHKSIVDVLRPTGLPIVSEEDDQIPYSVRRKWKLFWMIDPLDGTKEFLKKNGEFTVNIALIKNQIPVIGVVYAPIIKTIYYAEETIGSFMAKDFINLKQILDKGIRMPYFQNQKNEYRIVISSSHLNVKTRDHIEKIKIKNDNVKILKIGSSLKICLLAEGKADYYPRFNPLMEWDIAAAFAILIYSDSKFKTNIKYFNQKSMLIPNTSFQKLESKNQNKFINE